MNVKTNKTLVLSSNDVQEIVLKKGLNEVMDALIKRLTIALKEFDPSETVIPIRAGFNYEKPSVGLVEWMPLYEKGKEVVIKVVGYHPDNPTAHRLPTILSTLSAYDTTTGHLHGLMDGVLSTALRTGASSAVASRLLAHPNSSTLGLIGCGAQSITQLHALSRIFDLKKVLIYDTDASAMMSFSQRSAALHLQVEIIPSSIQEIVQMADIISTSTSIDVGEGPLFQSIPTQPHLHINAVGSDFPGKTELPLAHLKNSFVCPDFRSQAVVEGECQQLEAEDIGADWIQVLRDKEKYAPIRQQLSVFDSTGWALEDQVIMQLFLEYAEELSLGQLIEIENISEDAKNPYAFMQEIPAETLTLRDVIYKHKE